MLLSLVGSEAYAHAHKPPTKEDILKALQDNGPMAGKGENQLFIVPNNKDTPVVETAV